MYIVHYLGTFFSIFIIVVILKPMLTETITHDEERVSGNSKCEDSFNRSGNYFLPVKEDCRNVYRLNLTFENPTSIFNLTVSIKYLGDSTEEKEKTPVSEATFSIKVSEITISHDNTKGQSVLLQEWHENSNTIPCQRSYLSRSSQTFILTEGTGNLSHYELEFFFEEIEYRLIPLKPSEKDSHMTWATYWPNSVSLLRLYEQEMPRTAVEIWFNNLHINTEMGEYLLIGAGTEPFKDKNLPPLYITQVTENSTFYVGSSSAYIAFVSGSIKKGEEGFRIFWNGTQVMDIDVPEDPMGVLNSSLICFYDYSKAIQEFEKRKDRRFEKFRQHFSEIAKTYLHGEYKNIQLNKRAIDLFGKPTKQKINNTDALTILIKVLHKGKSIFTWKQLQTIIRKFGEKSEEVLGYKVGICPETNEFDRPYKSDWKFVMYALVPVFGLVVLMVWAWKQHIFSQNCMPEKEEKLSFDHMHAEPNTYVTTTIPKICRVDEQGRRETLIQSSPQENERDVKNTATTVEMNAIPSTSEDQDTLSRFLSSRKSKSRPSMKSLIDKNEENNRQLHSHKTERSESEHLYDSVSNDKQLNETRL